MHRLLLAATVGFGLLLGAGGVSSAFARPGPEHAAPAPTRAVPVNHDRYRPHVAPRYQYRQPAQHWYRPMPHRYQPPYYHSRPDTRHDMHRRNDRGWR